MTTISPEPPPPSEPVRTARARVALGAMAHATTTKNGHGLRIFPEPPPPSELSRTFCPALDATLGPPGPMVTAPAAPWEEPGPMVLAPAECGTPSATVTATPSHPPPDSGTGIPDGEVTTPRQAAITPTTAGTDLDIVARSIALLIEPGKLFEVRALPWKGKGACSRFFLDIREAVHHVATIAQTAKAVYLTLNPIRNDRPLVGRNAAKDDDITIRSWLLIDIDPARPGHCSASDQEKRAAWDKTQAVHNWLDARGWPQPLVCDSGNGFHVLHRIGLPNDEEAGGLVRDVLQAHHHKLSEEYVEIDTSNYNASRITKLYGTVAKKGESTRERPWRTSSIIASPSAFEVVSWAALEAVAAQRPSPQKKTTTKGARSAEQQGVRQRRPWRGSDQSPADWYAAHTTWEELLLPFDWTIDHVLKDGEIRWMRPGKVPGEGHGATTSHDGREVLYVFTNQEKPFEEGGTYSKFQAIALLKFGGDESAAARYVLELMRKHAEAQGDSRAAEGGRHRIEASVELADMVHEAAQVIAGLEQVFHTRLWPLDG